MSDGRPAPVRRAPPAPWLALCAAVCLWVAPATSRAADLIVLPPGEAPAAWQGTLQLVGLSLGARDRAPGGEDRVIRVERTDAGWMLRAQNAAGTVRTARIAAPSTPSDREEVAFLAAALVRDLGVGSARPPPVIRLPPPPVVDARIAVSEAPPVFATPATPASPAGTAEPVDPDVASVAYAPSDLGPRSLPESAASSTATTSATWTSPVRPGAVPPLRVDVPDVLDIEPDRSTELRRQRRGPGVVTPPLTASTTLSFRIGTNPAVTQSLGWEPAKLGDRASLGIALSYTAPHQLQLGLQRTLFAYGALGSVDYALGRFTRCAAFGGASWRMFRQQRTPIREGLTPVVGASAAIRALGAGRWTWWAVAGATLDLGVTRFVLEDGTQQDLVPVDLSVAMKVRFSGARDPSGPDPTSTR